MSIVDRTRCDKGDIDAALNYVQHKRAHTLSLDGKGANGGITILNCRANTLLLAQKIWNEMTNKVTMNVRH